RFLVLGREDSKQPTGDDKTSLVMSVRDEVGVLARMLRPFATHGIDLIKIESRPLRERPWEYYFFLDLKGHRREARVARALEAVRRRALRLKGLGSDPAAPDREPGWWPLSVASCRSGSARSRRIRPASPSRRSNASSASRAPSSWRRTRIPSGRRRAPSPRWRRRSAACISTRTGRRSTCGAG